MKLSNEVIGLKEKLTDNEKIRLAQKLWEMCQPIEGTAAELYLTATRKIPAEIARQLEFRYLRGPIGIASLDNNKHDDYVVAPVYNLDDELVGLQIIQIDSEGNKAQAVHVKAKDFYCKKYIGASRPLRPGKAALINQGSNSDCVFIAEGVETAASIATIQAIRENFSILASMGVTELPAVIGYIKTHFRPHATIVLLKDHDGADSDADIAFQKARDLFLSAGYKVIVKEPTPKDSDKEGYDWNDLLIDGGEKELELQFELNISVNSEDTSLRDAFKKLYTQLLVSENIAEEHHLLQSLSVVVNQQLAAIKGRPFGEQFSTDYNTNKALLLEMGSKIQDIMTALRFVHKTSAPYFSLPQIPKVLSNFLAALNQLQQDQAALRNEKGEEQQIEHPQLEALDAAYDYVLGEYKTYLSTEGKFSPSPLPKEGEEFKYYVDIFLQVLQPHIEGKASFAFVRQQLRPAYDRLKKEIRAEGAANIQNNLQICMDLKDDAVISLILYIKSLGFLVNLKEQSLEEKMQSEAYRAYQDHYLALHEELEPIGNLQTLQQWLNNLDNFKTLRPLQYEPPKQEESREVEFIFEDENEKETLETLIKEILDNIPLEEVEDNEKGKEIEKEADPFEQAVNDYAMELAVSLYKTFEVSSPCRLYRQEFDGLVSRDGQLTIIERKSNDGTGPGVLQRNFCQQKIMSKEQFVQKNWLPAILHDAHPESFIDIHIPARKDWYCEEFSEEIQDMLILAAKLTVVKALRELRLEFNLNLPKHYSGKVYQGVFFSPSRLNDVTVRFSQLRKGDEDVAHSRMDEIRSSMSQMIRRGQ